MSIRTDRLRILREQQGWSQREFARRCRLNQSVVRKYELGEADPTGDSLIALSQQLGVTTDYLLGLSNDPQISVREPVLDDHERFILETYRREGWLGLAHLSVDKLGRSG